MVYHTTLYCKKKKSERKKKITAPQGSLTLHWYTKRNEINQDETAKNNGTLFFVFHQAERNKSYGHDMILYKHIQKKKTEKNKRSCALSLRKVTPCLQSQKDQNI